jgi:hypothetical protein
MHFRFFTQGKCTFGEINVDLCNRFRDICWQHHRDCIRTENYISTQLPTTGQLSVHHPYSLSWP